MNRAYLPHTTYEKSTDLIVFNDKHGIFFISKIAT